MDREGSANLSLLSYRYERILAVDGPFKGTFDAEASDADVESVVGLLRVYVFYLYRRTSNILDLLGVSQVMTQDEIPELEGNRLFGSGREYSIVSAQPSRLARMLLMSIRL